MNTTKSLKPPPTSEVIDPVDGKSVAEVLGEIVWLMTQDKDARDLSIKDLEWLVMPPILLRQFHISYASIISGERTENQASKSDAISKLQPISVEFFAMCSEAVAAALDADVEHRLKLTIQDWRSGQHKRIVRKITTFSVDGLLS